MALNGGDSPTGETERSTSGNGQNIYDKMEFFMQIGCLCIEDIYEFDTEFFDEVVSAAADCATTTAGATKSTVLVPTSMGSGFGGCPNLNTLYNGFADLNQETMRESVDAMPKTYSPPPPRLATLAPRDHFRLDVWIPGYDVADVKTHNEKSSLEFALETALNMSAGLEVEILDVYRGAPINLTSENSTDSTILKIKVVSTAGTELTSSQLHGIHDKSPVLRARLQGLQGLDLNAYGHEITSPTLTDGTSIPAPLDRGTVPQAQPSSGPRKLPAASTGLPRQGLSGTYEGGFEVTNMDYLLSLVGQGFPGIGMAILLVVVMILMIIVYSVATICGATCCKCCNGAYKPRKFSNRDLKINKVVILVFVALTAAGAFIVFAEGPALMEHTSDLTQAMADTISDLLDRPTRGGRGSWSMSVGWWAWWYDDPAPITLMKAHTWTRPFRMLRIRSTGCSSRPAT